MIIVSLSCNYLIDRFSDYEYCIFNEDEDFLVFVVCDVLEDIDYGYKISRIFSRSFCDEVYNNRYITNLKNLIEVGFFEALNRVNKFIQEQNIECSDLNISINGGVYKNGKLMLFSLGIAPIFVIDKNNCLYCPFSLDENCNLKNWREYIKYKLIEPPRDIIACSSKLDGKLFKYIKNDKLEVKPYKYKILEIVNTIISNKENFKKIKNKINKKLGLNLEEDIPLLVISFDETSVDDTLVKIGKPKPTQKKSIEIDNINRINYSNSKNYNKNYYKKLKFLGVISFLLLIIMLMCLMILFNTSYSKSSDTLNTTINVLDFNDSKSNKTALDKINLSSKNYVVNKVHKVYTNNNLYKSNINQLKIFVKFLGYINKNTVRLSVIFPEKGYYYISICSKDKNLKLININNDTNVIYKNETQIWLFEKITEKEKNYSLIISKENISSVKDILNIKISKIEIK